MSTIKNNNGNKLMPSDSWSGYSRGESVGHQMLR